MSGPGGVDARRARAPTRVAVVGSGGREHALAWALQRADRAREVYTLPGNAGTPGAVPIAASDFEGIERFCRERRVELVIVGPEAPLVEGLVDRLAAAGVRAFGPTRSAARLEGSKLFAKRFMQRHGVATAEFWSFGAGDDPSACVDRLGGRLVLKFDGLAAGKGVWVCGDRREARAAVDELRARYGADAAFLIERRLEGDELSLLGLVDGRRIRLLPAAQDHKALLDGDRGPNTGGMGAYAPVPGIDRLLHEAIERQVVGPTLEGLRAEGIDYRGILYFGLMLTDEGPRLLEYNVRLGDPEAEVLLALLESDFAELAVACLEGRLDALDLRARSGFAVDVVLASEGYPGLCALGRPIEGLEGLDSRQEPTSSSGLVFHGATRRQGSRIVTDGGRVLNVIGRGQTLEEAIEQAYALARQVSFEGAQYRKDIGRRAWKHRSGASPS